MRNISFFALSAERPRRNHNPVAMGCIPILISNTIFQKEEQDLLEKWLVLGQAGSIQDNMQGIVPESSVKKIMIDISRGQRNQLKHSQ